MKKLFFALFVLLVACLGGGPAWALSVTARPGTCTGTGWVNPNNAAALDASFATHANDSLVASGTLRCTGFGFAIPPSATINGIVVTIVRRSNSVTAGSKDATVQLMKNAVATGSNLAGSIPYTLDALAEDHGSDSELWGSFWNPGEINHASFGVSYAFKKGNAAAPAQTVSIDQISVTVFYSVFQCKQPPTVPKELALTCLCDTFERTNVQPSPIFNSNWALSVSDNTGIPPRIVNPGYLRLTDATESNAKAVSVPGIFPAAGNYVSVEFTHYAYGGWIGADGMVMVLSDYALPPQPGGLGGSMGYAPKINLVTGVNTEGFSGGWLGVALDEYGNFGNATEGRLGSSPYSVSGPPMQGLVPQSVQLRGSGAGLEGYAWIAGTNRLDVPLATYGIDNTRSKAPAPGYRYQIVVDARNNDGNSGPVVVGVNRDTSGSGTAYSPLISPFDIYSVSPSQLPVPANFRLSFTSGTGGYHNIHEIGALRICAQPFESPQDGVLGAFNIIDSRYPNNMGNVLLGHIYTKLAGTDFNLNVAAINPPRTGVLRSYAASTNRSVKVELIDDSLGQSCNASSSACSGCNKPVVATQTITFTAADQGFKPTATFNVGQAYKRLIARASDGVNTGCSIDAFSVRPLAFTEVTGTANNSTMAGSPRLKAGTDEFSMRVVAGAANYTGTPKINPAAVQANTGDWTVGSLLPQSFDMAISSVASGNFTYSEVGLFKLLGYDQSNTTSGRGIFDDEWTAVDQGAQKDCVAGSYANTLDASGKYGCLFGILKDTPFMGRFVPDHFAVTSNTLTAWSNGFTWMGQPALGLSYQIEARNGAKAKTLNYSAALGYPVSNPVLVAEDNSPANAGCNLASRLGGMPSVGWAGGVYGVVAPNLTFSRPVAPGQLNPANCNGTVANATGPFAALDIGVSMYDADAGVGITRPAYNMNAQTGDNCVQALNCNAVRLGSTSVLYGRVKMTNGYGATRLPLSIPIEVQYWNGSTFVRNTNDSATTFALPPSFTVTNPTVQAAGTVGMTGTLPGGLPGLYFYSAKPNNLLASANTVASLASPLAMAGSNAIKLTAPGAPYEGWLDILLAVPPWLGGSWGNCLGQSGQPGQFVNNPCARATFGLYKSSLLYRRENY